MKNKILLTSALALAISVPAMALDVTSTSSCTETTLGTATGPVDIEADWQANTINLTWDANNGTVSGGPTQCIYDGTFTLPTSITRTGYEFAGWLVKNGPAQCSASVIAGLDPSIEPEWDSDYTRWKPLNGDSGYTMSDEFETENSSDLSNGEWAVTFSYGTIKGMAKCSAKSGNNHSYKWGGNSSDWTAEESELTSASGAKRYCWCQPTSYTPAGGEMCTVNSSSSWVFSIAYGDADGCASPCAHYCTGRVQVYSAFRSAMFGLFAN